MKDRIEVNAVAFQQGEMWVAQCVEFDIAAFAKSLPELPRALKRALAANLCVNADLHRQGFDQIPPAPARFREMFEAAQLDVFPKGALEQGVIGEPVNVRTLRVAEAA